MIRVRTDTEQNPEETGGCWPTRHQKLLLRAALLEKSPAQAAWLQWNREVDLIEDLLDLGSFRLLPLVYHNLQRHGVDGPHMGRLRGIYRRTWVENQVRLHTCAQVIEALHSAHIQTMLLKGAALLALHYPNHGARPMSDIDVWVPMEQVRQAVGILAARQWLPADRPLERLTPDYFAVRHSQGFANHKQQEIDLHWHVLNTALDSRVDDALWAGSVPAKLHETRTRALNHTDQLLHVCVHGAAWSSTPPVRWAADAAIILQTAQTAGQATGENSVHANHTQANHASHIDWARLIHMAQMGWCSLQLHATLRYLAEALDQPIPQTVLDELAATRVTPEEKQVFAVSTRRSVGLGHLPVLWHRHRQYLAQSRSLGNAPLPPISANGAAAPAQNSAPQPPTARDKISAPISFPRYLQIFLGLSSPLEVGGWLLSRIVKRARLLLTDSGRQ